MDASGKRVPCGLADLAIAFKLIKPSHEDCAAIARMVGLNAREIFNPISSFKPVEGGAPQPKHDYVEHRHQLDPAILQTAPRSVVPRPYEIDRRVDPPAEEITQKPSRLIIDKPPPTGGLPPYVADADEFDMQRGVPRAAVTPAPIVPVRQLRSLVCDLTSGDVPGPPDLRKLVELWARRCVPTAIPRLHRRGFATRVHILWDTSDPMWLFQYDIAQLFASLHATRGGAIQSESHWPGPPDHTALPELSPGDLLLVISDFGIGAGASIGRERSRGWTRLAALYRKRGVKLIALVPFCRERWPLKLKRAFRIHRLGRPGLVACTANIDLYRLALYLSVAAVVDSALLRHFRLKLFPRSDPGSEIDFLRSEWVASYNTRVIIFHPHWTSYFRSQLAQSSEDLKCATRLLATHRSKDRSWSRVACEEDIVSICLNDLGGNRLNVEKALGRVIRSLFGKMRDASSARWALHLFDTLPETVRNSRAAQLLKAVALAVLGTRHEEYAEVFQGQNIQWTLSASVSIGVKWTGEHIVVREPPAPGDKIIEVPATWPRIVIVCTADGFRNKVLRVTPWKGGWTRATTLPRLIRTASGTQYRLEEFDEDSIWIKLEAAYKVDEPQTGIIVGRDAFGHFRIDLGIEAMLHKNELEVKSPDEDRKLLGQCIRVRIIRLNRAKRKVTVTMRAAAPRDVWGKLRERFKSGKPVAGTVQQMNTSGFVVDIGIPAFLPMAEMDEAAQVRMRSRIGQSVECYIVDMSSVKKGRIVLSMRGAEQSLWETLSNDHERMVPVRGKIVRGDSGGFVVNIGITATLVDEERELHHELPQLEGQEVEVELRTINRADRVVRVSYHGGRKLRSMLAAWDKLKVGDMLDGTVKSIVDVGAFVECGLVTGLLRPSDASRAIPPEPISNILQVGQSLRVVVLSIDRERRRVSFGITPPPDKSWGLVRETLKVSEKVKCTVTGTTRLGFHTLIQGGVNGFLHKNEVPLSCSPYIGFQCESVVLGFDDMNKRVLLTLRGASRQRFSFEECYPIGSEVAGVVTNVANFAAFVELDDGIVGFIPAAELSWIREIDNAAKVLRAGDRVKAIVLSWVIERRQIALSVRLLQPNPWETVEVSYPIGETVTGTIVGIRPYGVFVELPNGIVAMAHLGPAKGASEGFEMGNQISVKIISIDKTKRRISLGIDRGV